MVARPSSEAPHLSRGHAAEHAALCHLQRQGLTLLQRNFRCRGGEIDLVMMQQQELVFVEVRYRSSECYGGALQSISHHKQQRLRLAAETYLSQHPELAFCGCRFDAVGVTGADTDYQFNWLSDAF